MESTSDEHDHGAQVKKAEKKPPRTAAVQEVESRRQEYLDAGGRRERAGLERFYDDFERQAYTWLVSDHRLVRQWRKP